jgi:FkbM family methyltransferase
MDIHNIEPLFSRECTDFNNKVGRALKMTGMSAFDIGACFGKHIPDLISRFAKVYAFEPVPNNFDELSKIKNDRLEIFRLAFSDKPGKLEKVNVFNTWSLLPDDSKVADRALDYAGSNAFDCEVTSIDAFCEDYFYPDFIKIDVDGFEPLVLEGGRKTLAKAKCPIFIEYSYLPERFFGYPKERFVNLIYNLGYKAYSQDGKYCAETPKDMLACYPHHTSYDIVLLHNDFK